MNKLFVSYLFNPNRKGNLIYILNKEIIMDNYKYSNDYKEDKNKVVTEYGMLDFVFDKTFIENKFKNVSSDDFLIDIIKNELKINKNLRYWVSENMLYFSRYEYALRALLKKGVNVSRPGGSASDYIESNEEVAIDLLLNGDWWFSDSEMWDIRCGN